MKNKSNFRPSFPYAGAFLCFAGMLMAFVAEGAPSHPVSSQAATGSWTVTGSLATPRFEHTATLLANNMVLVVGGFDAGGRLLASAELYDPASGTWTATGSLNVGRADQTATLLPDGKVLVAGGVDRKGYSASAELYDPTSGTWSPTGSLNLGRSGHSATLLSDGKVLVAGGIANTLALTASAELYDPVTGIWTPTGSLHTARNNQTATLLPNGSVLIAGGLEGDFEISTGAELYNPASGSWSVTGNLHIARRSHTATLLPNGAVLVAGGFDINFSPSKSAELYDPASGSWSETSSLNNGRYFHTATLLPDGTVLVAGGFDDDFNSSAKAELYDPSNASWTITGSLKSARDRHTAILLGNGTVLVAAGDGTDNPLASAELYQSNGGDTANLLSAASRLIHSLAGDFDIDMPLTGISGVECRDARTYEAVFTFDVTVTSGDVSVVAGTATTGTPTFSGKQVIVPLTGVANAQVLTLRLEDVNGNDQHWDVSFGFLIGDADSNRRVDRGDVAALQGAYGHPVDGSTFRADFHPDGRINRKDRADLRSHLGTSL
jgi:N-acetylneuraminic acid mutarotase